MFHYVFKHNAIDRIFILALLPQLRSAVKIEALVLCLIVTNVSLYYVVTGGDTLSYSASIFCKTQFLAILFVELCLPIFFYHISTFLCYHNYRCFSIPWNYVRHDFRWIYI